MRQESLFSRFSAKAHSCADHFATLTVQASIAI
jgi:hypothetical protein